MGGSGGGGGYFSSDPRRVAKEVQTSHEASDAQEFEAQSNQGLQELLTQFNNRNNEAISRHLQEIKDVLSEDIEGTLDTRFGGSVAKHTFVDGLSDVDSLVLLNKSELSDQTPEAVKAFFADQLADNVRGATVKEGALAVTVDFEH